jgi:hypothetical protein
MAFGEGKFGRPSDGREEIELAAIVERQEPGSFGPWGTKGSLLSVGGGLGIDIVTFG